MPEDASASSPRVLIPPQTLRLDRAAEDRLVSYALDRMDYHRKQMGYDGHGSYRRESWLWKRWVATRMFENDFSSRVMEGSLFSRVNLSLGMVKQFIEQHKSRMVKDMLPGENFFGLVPEGPEDQNEVLRDAERWLQRQATRGGLLEKCRTAGLLGALIRGEAVAKTTLRVERKMEMRRARAQIGSDGQIVTDRHGLPVTELDRWVPAADNPAQKMLERDPTRRMAADGEPRYGPEIDLPVPLSETRGSSVEFPFWADFVCPLAAASLDTAELLGHAFEAAVPDLMDLQPANQSPCCGDYLEMVRGQKDTGEATERRAAREHAGEDDTNGRWDGDEGSYCERRFDECYFRFDWRGNGRFDHIAMLIDREARWPIYYGLASEIMPWTDAHHPFTALRINPVDGRWHGSGYYEQYGDMADFADKCWCRIELELQKAGNKIVENTDLHEDGRAGIPINFRDTTALQVTGSTRPEDVLHVVTVKPQVMEIAESMDTMLQKLQSHVGVAGPGDPTSEALNNSDTLGEARIQEANKSVTIEEREGELAAGFNAILHAMAEIELDPRGMDMQAVARLLESTALAAMQPLPQLLPAGKGGNGPPMPEAPAAAPQPAMPMLPQAPALSGAQRAERLARWASEIGDDLRDVLKLFLTRSRETKLFDQTTKILQVMEKWLAYPPGPVRKTMRPLFAKLLRGLEVQNPDAMLGPDEPEAGPPATAAASGQPAPNVLPMAAQPKAA